MNSNLFDREVDRIWRQTANRDLLGDGPPVADGKPHEISVNGRRQGLRVRAR